MIKDGRLNFEYKNGRITGVSISANLGWFYERMLSEHQSAFQRDPHDIPTNIGMVVFGCFWLEAICNEYTRFILLKESKSEKFGKLVWQKAKRLKLPEKMDLICVVATAKQVDKFKSLSNGINRAFELRNRLAHFKDEDEKLASRISKERADQLVQQSSDPALIRELKPPKINTHVRSIVAAAKWVESTYRSYCQRRKIYSKIIEVPSESTMRNKATK